MNVKKLKLGIVSLLLAVGVMAPLAAPVSVGAQISDESKTAACQGLGNVDCKQTGAGDSVAKLLASAINILSWIVGIVAVFMMIIGGFKFILSSGDSAGINSARNTIIYALVGLVVAALAQVMVKFVLARV